MIGNIINLQCIHDPYRLENKSNANQGYKFISV